MYTIVPMMIRDFIQDTRLIVVNTFLEKARRSIILIHQEIFALIRLEDIPRSFGDMSFHQDAHVLLPITDRRAIHAIDLLGLIHTTQNPAIQPPPFWTVAETILVVQCHQCQITYTLTIDLRIIKDL